MNFKLKYQMQLWERNPTWGGKMLVAFNKQRKWFRRLLSYPLSSLKFLLVKGHPGEEFCFMAYVYLYLATRNRQNFPRKSMCNITEGWNIFQYFCFRFDVQVRWSIRKDTQNSFPNG
jgi:hypothetical protein